MARGKEGGDRVALVTGAGSGIGRASVARLLQAGWKVATVDCDGTALASLFLLDGTRSSYMAGEIVVVDGGFHGAGILAPQ